MLEADLISMLHCPELLQLHVETHYGGLIVHVLSFEFPFVDVHIEQNAEKGPEAGAGPFYGLHLLEFKLVHVLGVKLDDGGFDACDLSVDEVVFFLHVVQIVLNRPHF